VTHLGLKNVDVRRELTNVRVPLGLFGADPQARGKVLTRSECDRLTKAHCPALNDKVVSQVNRKILRQSRESPFSMALL
jgi:hypothetical protein